MSMRAKRVVDAVVGGGDEVADVAKTASKSSDETTKIASGVGKTGDDAAGAAGEAADDVVGGGSKIPKENGPSRLEENGVYYATDDGVVLNKGQDYDLVPTSQPKADDPQWLQIHQNHAHNGMKPHVHKPEIHSSPNGKKLTKRVDEPLSDDVLRAVDRRLKDGELRLREHRKDRGGS